MNTGNNTVNKTCMLRFSLFFFSIFVSRVSVGWLCDWLVIWLICCLFVCFKQKNKTKKHNKTNIQHCFCRSRKQTSMENQILVVYLTYKQTDGRTDGQTVILRTLEYFFVFNKISYLSVNKMNS